MKPLVFLVLAAGMLSACATTAPLTPVQQARARLHAPAAGTMAPIPNPVEPEAAKAPRPPMATTTEHASAAKPAPPKAAQTAQAAPAAPPPANDPAQAARLRVTGLEQLNRGAVGNAVALLQKAQLLDPDNALIRRDLDRALRISRAVSAKP